MTLRFDRLLLLLVLAGGCSSPWIAPGPTLPEERDDLGVLVMAHGGSAEWNAGVLDAVAPLRDEWPLAVAFGMADAASIQTAVAKLEARGARRIGVVRLFVSGESWYERTEEILGLRPGAPAAAEAAPDAHHPSGGGHEHRMEFWRVRSRASFALTTEGLADAEASGTILADRARALSRDPEREVVLVLAHGPGDDEEDERWLAALDARAEAVRRALPFRDVRVMTLREDWPEKREAAERRIRAFVGGAAAKGLTLLVIPFRVQGFGPYADVLAGLEYVADGQGLIPHSAVTGWIGEQIERLRHGSFRRPVDSSNRQLTDRDRRRGRPRPHPDPRSSSIAPEEPRPVQAGGR